MRSSECHFSFICTDKDDTDDDRHTARERERES